MIHTTELRLKCMQNQTLQLERLSDHESSDLLQNQRLYSFVAPVLIITAVSFDSSTINAINGGCAFKIT